MNDQIRSATEVEACKRKRRFSTEREAENAAYQARMDGRALGVYACPWCGGWHLTSKERA
jgi:hypothetical protein